MHSSDQDSADQDALGPQAWIDEAWHQLYLDGQRSGVLGQRVVEWNGAALPAALVGEAWFHVAFAALRAGRFDAAEQANARARALFESCGDARRLLLCDEVEAMRLSVSGRLQDAMALHLAIDSRTDIPRPAIDRYISHNSRGLTRKQMGQTDETLLDLYRALDAANQAESPGPRINAMCNLSGIHSDQFNHIDAQALGEQALEASERAGAWVPFGISALNLIQAYDGLGRPADCLHAAQRLLAREDRLPPGLISRPYVAIAFLGVGDLVQAQQWLDHGPNAPFGDGDGKTEWCQVQSRVYLQRGDYGPACSVAEARLQECRVQTVGDQPYNRLRLLEAAADARERLGHHQDAMRHLREAHALYESMVGRSARARFLAIQAQHEFAQAQRERDLAQRAQRKAERDRQQLAALNDVLQSKIAEAEALQAQLREQALSDVLTGLHNRRYLYEVAPGWLQLALRKNAAVSLALIDLDHFKGLNDTLGHDAGDLVLQRFAQVLKLRLRSSDIVCRHGGEEFVVMASDADTASLRTLLTALIEECRRLRLDTPGGTVDGFTFSAGVVACPGDGRHLPELLQAADTRLYRAKADGRARAAAAS